jgi:hypothetical protein
MRLFSRRAPEVPRSPPTIEAIFREDLGFIVGSLGRFGIAAIDVDDAAHEVIRAAERTLPRFDPSRDLRSWLYGVAFTSPRIACGGPGVIGRVSSTKRPTSRTRSPPSKTI